MLLPDVMALACGPQKILSGPGDQPHRFVVHDCDTIYSEGVDAILAAMGLTVLKTLVRGPEAHGGQDESATRVPPNEGIGSARPPTIRSPEYKSSQTCWRNMSVPTRSWTLGDPDPTPE